MLLKLKIAMTSFVIALVFLTSAVVTVPALADDAQPPATPEAIVSTEPVVEPATIDASSPDLVPDPTQEAVSTLEAQPTEIAAPTEEPVAAGGLSSNTPENTTPVDEPVVTDAGNLLANMPENTDVVVINQDGDSVPLATQEAADIIVVGDPIWCPATVKIPKAGVGGCTDPAGNAYDPTSLQSLFDYLTNNQPGVDGVIWIESDYDNANDNGPITIDGSSLTMSNFKLTLRGGWVGCPAGVCVGTIDTSHPSTFDDAISIINWKNDVTLSDIVVDASAADVAGLQVTTTKNILLDRVKSNNNTGVGGSGALLDNTASTTASTITVNNSQFSGNDGYGIKILSKGNITLSNIIVENNGAGQHGAEVDNSTSTTAATVTVSTGLFDGNGLNGLQLTSKGKIFLSNITANNNGNSGASVDNSNAVALLDVLVTGDNTFTSNDHNGLFITSKGAITLNNVLASGNGTVTGVGNNGVYLKNTFTGAVGAITLTGTNVFTENFNHGLFVESYGAIKANNITASSNGQSGANLQNTSSVAPQPITLTGTNRFEDNYFGLIILTNGLITTSNINANININTGVRLDNGNPGAVAGIIMNGTNTFYNNGLDGLTVKSNGAITLANLNASENAQWGANLNNTSASVPANVTLSGVNSFNGNGSDGLYIQSDGIITLNSVSAINNTGSGTSLNNQQAANIVKGITFTGTNVFNDNHDYGLVISSYGIVTLTNITASYNGTTFGDGVNITNDAGVTPSGVTLTGTNTFNGNHASGLSVASLGAIVVNNVTADDNEEYGVKLINKNGSAPVTVVGAPSLTHNQNDGLFVQSKGIINVSNINASQSISGYGANLDNTFSLTQLGVVLGGKNTFSSNYKTGLFIRSYGVITINNVTATSNGLASTGYGADVSNLGASIAKAITIAGVNNFSSNKSGGLLVTAKGAITIVNVVASNNTNGDGVNLNNGGSSAFNISVSGANTFYKNYGDGLQINSLGTITLSNINASENGFGGGSGRGVMVFNNALGSIGNVTVSGVNTFSSNTSTGLYIWSLGTISISGVTANNNIVHGVRLDNVDAPIVKNVILGGVNTFTGNTVTGLYINTKGAVTSTSKVTLNANSNQEQGILIDNTFGDIAKPQLISLLGKVNVLYNSSEGLKVNSNGAITISNIVATGNNTSGNGAAGVFLLNVVNPVPAKPAGVTVNGTGNIFTENETVGLKIQSSGAILVSNITALNNGVTSGGGVRLENNGTSKVVGITVTGINKFIGNYLDGLFIDSAGPVSLSNVTASDNISGGGVYINNKSLGTSLPQGVTLTGTNTFINNGDDGLYIDTYGFVTLSGVKANQNGHYGLYVVNSAGYIPKNVTISGTNYFNENQVGGIYVHSIGTIAISNLNVNDTASGTGAYIHNDNIYTVNAVNKQSVGIVTLSGINTFDGNHVYGLDVGSYGAITLSNINASNNGNTDVTPLGHGMIVNNRFSTASVAPKVTLTGTNIFNNNKEKGFDINSKGVITVTNLTANNNGSYGAYFDNTGGNAGVSITGFSTTLSNGNSGTVIYSNGAVNLVKTTSDNNAVNGLYVQTSSTVMLTCGSFTNNTSNGLYIFSASKLTLKGVVAAGNGTNIDTGSVSPSSVFVVRTCPLP